MNERRTMSKRSSIIAITGALCASVLLSACGSGSANNARPADDTAAASKVSGTITVYTSEPQNKLNDIIKDFNVEYPDIHVKNYRAGTGDLTTRIEAEQANGSVGADILWAADAATFEGYKATKLIDGVSDADGYYTGTRIIPTVIAYNTTAITAAPTSWKDLANAKYNGKLVMPNPAVSGAAAYNAAAWYLDKNLGEQWFTDLGKNKPVIADSNGPVSQPVGVVVDYLIRDLKAKGSPLSVSYPSEGAPYVSEPIGIFKSSKNKEAAKAFVDYIISKQGQKKAVEQNYLPVRKDVGTPKDTPSMDKIKLLNPDLSKITEVKKTALNAFNWRASRHPVASLHDCSCPSSVRDHCLRIDMVAPRRNLHARGTRCGPQQHRLFPCRRIIVYLHSCCSCPVHRTY